MRWSAVLAGIIVLSIAPAPAALAAGSRDVGHGTEVTVTNPARVDGTLWVDSRGAYLVAIREWQCWYPQGWYEDVVIVDDTGNFVGHNTDSIHYDYVVNRLGADPDLFADIPLYSDRSCIQDAFVARGDCSTEERIGVLSSHAIRDAYLGDITLARDFDFEDRSGLYCLVVIERDPWLDLIRDQSYVPEPVRATYPEQRTLVGLDNRVWYDVAPGIDRVRDGFSVTIETAGIDYNLTLEIWLTEIRVDTDGDGVWDFVKECPATDPELLDLCAGSVDDPILTFNYENRAFHPFAIETRWGGLAIDPDGIALDIDPNLLLNQYTFDWETVEVRSSLDG